MDNTNGLERTDNFVRNRGLQKEGESSRKMARHGYIGDLGQSQMEKKIGGNLHVTHVEKVELFLDRTDCSCGTNTNNMEYQSV